MTSPRDRFRGTERMHGPHEQYDPRGPAGWRGSGDRADLKELLSRLGQDASQLAHDEMTLARLELRSITTTLSDDLQNASRTLVKDMAKVGIALTLATLAGLALTAGAIIGVGILVGAYWAGGLIVGGVLLLLAAVFGISAARDLQTSDALRLEKTRRSAERSKDVLAAEAEETKRFASEEASELKYRASPPEKPRPGAPHRH
jgi:ABC-type multidrug transport system fused ATPase/permease subunit